jgi:HSP20 family protein
MSINKLGIYLNQLYGFGTLYAFTPNEVARLASALLDHRILDPEEERTMTLFRGVPSFDFLVREFGRLQTDLESALGRNGRRGVGRSFPPMNIWEDDETVYLEAELPGYQLADLEVFVAGTEQLTIKGERKAQEHAEGVCHRQERGFGSFTRSVTLPVAVDANKVQAKLDQGVLQVKLPKWPLARPKQIAISV